MALLGLSEKGRRKIKLTTITPFWHRRICEAIFAFGLIILGLFAWSNTVGIDRSAYLKVSEVAAGLSALAIVVAIVSYILVPQRFQTITSYIAYWILLLSTGIVNLTTGATESPFIATWIVAVIFAGLFGPTTLAILFIGLNGVAAYLAVNGEMTGVRLLNLLLVGELPILVSYILWHGKSTTDRSREKAYSDLANTLDQVANKSEVVISAISDGVIAINNKGGIELINPAAQKIIGWGNQDALNLNYQSVLHLIKKDGTEIEKSQDPIFEVLGTNLPIRRNDLQLETSSGKKIMIEIVVSPIGRMGSGAIIVFRDITIEHQKESAQAEFISTASHEMRTPVASIEGYLGLALNPAIATIDDKAREYLSKAHDGAKHLGRLFQDLLDVTKADDGRLSNKPQVVNMVEFVGTIAEGLRQRAIEKKLRLIYKPQVSEPGGTRNLEPVFFVNVDNDHLREVVSNLIDNAIKYTPEGTVIVDVKGDESRVVVRIQDSGIGIPAEDIPHLFQKFYRVDNSDTREIGGTGLGLYLCRRLVETMGGRIWVNSERKKGSTFYVELERISHEDAMRLIERTDSQATSAPIVAETRAQNPPGVTTMVASQTSQPATTIQVSPSIIQEHRKISLQTQPTISGTRNSANDSENIPVMAPDALINNVPSGVAQSPAESMRASQTIINPTAVRLAQTPKTAALTDAHLSSNLNEAQKT